MHGEPNVMVTWPRPGVAGLTLNRPAKLNPLDRRTLTDISVAVRRLAEQECRCVVVSGAGRGFSAGADLSAFLAEENPSTYGSYLSDMLTAFHELATAPFPSIAAVHGVAFGGGLELVLACDLRIMADTARVGVPEIALGALPGGGAVPRLLRALPPTLARELVLTGRPLTAAECLSFGLVNRVVPEADLVARSTAWATEIAARPRDAVRVAKRLFAELEERPLAEPLETCRVAIADLMGHDDFQQGVSRFLRRRTETRTDPRTKP